MGFREYFQAMREFENDAPVGTVRVRGQSRVQKQRDGSWMRLGPARPGEAPPPRISPTVLKLPDKHKPSPSVPEIVIPTNRKWEDEAVDMPTSTTETMFKDDQPKPIRKALHERIFRTFSKNVEEVAPDKKPVAVLTMGGPVSGRSSAVKNLAQDSQFVRVDPGAIATLLPEYEEAVKKFARNAAALCQEEAAYIAHHLLEDAVSKRKNVAIDAAGVDAEAHSQMLSDLQEAGYFTVLVLTEMDRPDAIKRNRERGARTGRWVPREALTIGKVARENFEEIEEDADETLRIDNRGNAPKHVTEVLADLGHLFEADDDDDEKDEPERPEPEEPDIEIGEIRKMILEGIRKEKVRMSTLPEKYKPAEGVLLAHYDDAHIQPLEFEDDEEEPEEPEDGGEEPEGGTQ